MANELAEAGESSSPLGLVSRTTRGTFLRTRRFSSPPRWSGVVYLAGKPFRDGALAPDEISGSDGAIVDNSTGGAKTWIKVCVNPYAEAVSYEDAPVFVSGRFPPDTEYYERAKTAGDIHVSRFG